MKFIYAIIPFVNLATNDTVGGASHALHKIVIATPQRGTCHDNKIIPGATTLRVDSPTVINDTPPAKQRKFAQDLPVGHADNAYEACDNLLHKLEARLNALERKMEVQQQETLKQIQEMMEEFATTLLGGGQMTKEARSMKPDPSEITAADEVPNDVAQRNRIGHKANDSEARHFIRTKTNCVEQRNCIETTTTDIEQSTRIGTKATDVGQRKRIGTSIGTKTTDVEQKNIIVIGRGNLPTDTPFTLMQPGDQIGLSSSQWNPRFDQDTSEDSFTKTPLDYPNYVGDKLVKSLIVKWTSLVAY